MVFEIRAIGRPKEKLKQRAMRKKAYAPEKSKGEALIGKVQVQVSTGTVFVYVPVDPTYEALQERLSRIDACNIGVQRAKSKDAATLEVETHSALFLTVRIYHDLSDDGVPARFSPVPVRPDVRHRRCLSETSAITTTPKISRPHRASPYVTSVPSSPRTSSHQSPSAPSCEFVKNSTLQPCFPSPPRSLPTSPAPIMQECPSGKDTMAADKSAFISEFYHSTSPPTHACFPDIHIEQLFNSAPRTPTPEGGGDVGLLGEPWLDLLPLEDSFMALDETSVSVNMSSDVDANGFEDVLCQVDESIRTSDEFFQRDIGDTNEQSGMSRCVLGDNGFEDILRRAREM
ncbi:hypothetical protein SpCBS45565_g06602 [Spizellomyces sp. 'palustris']|nr:hypothetical protein SpCBS45565_g08125 [Spizellomyces sp. 'palustris']TPX63478.1 hypothetical protein SpCBS45565_g06602 [Spizellomyces sp. 'palustris']